MQNARIFFEKRGDAKYISHLDLMRCFSRAISRAEIPLWYTEGFNPRPYMNFAMPLSLGMEGLSEILDIRLNEEMSFDEVKSRLEKVMPPNIRIIDVKEPVKKAQLVAFSRYKIEIKQEQMPQEAFNNAVFGKTEGCKGNYLDRTYKRCENLVRRRQNNNCFTDAAEQSDIRNKPEYPYNKGA